MCLSVLCRAIIGRLQPHLAERLNSLVTQSDGIALSSPGKLDDRFGHHCHYGIIAIDQTQLAHCISTSVRRKCRLTAIATVFPPRANSVAIRLKAGHSIARRTCRWDLPPQKRRRYVRRPTDRQCAALKTGRGFLRRGHVPRECALAAFV